MTFDPMGRLSRLVRIALIAVWASSAAWAADAQIRKVLPSLLDREGRASLHPSLYERDAYQAHLRSKPTLVGGMRFDVHWSAPRTGTTPLELRLELRGSSVSTNSTVGVGSTNSVVLSIPVNPPRWGARWTRIQLEEAARQQVGDVTAWRATLLRDGSAVASSQSFLW